MRDTDLLRGLTDADVGHFTPVANYFSESHGCLMYSKSVLVVNNKFH